MLSTPPIINVKTKHKVEESKPIDKFYNVRNLTSNYNFKNKNGGKEKVQINIGGGNKIKLVLKKNDAITKGEYVGMYGFLIDKKGVRVLKPNYIDINTNNLHLVKQRKIYSLRKWKELEDYSKTNSVLRKWVKKQLKEMVTHENDHNTNIDKSDITLIDNDKENYNEFNNQNFYSNNMDHSNYNGNHDYNTQQTNIHNNNNNYVNDINSFEYDFEHDMSNNNDALHGSFNNILWDFINRGNSNSHFDKSDTNNNNESLSCSSESISTSL